MAVEGATAGRAEEDLAEGSVEGVAGIAAEAEVQEEEDLEAVLGDSEAGGREEGGLEESGK